MNTKVSKAVVVVVLLCAAGAAGWMIWKDTQRLPAPEQTQTPTTTPEVTLEPVGPVASDGSVKPNTPPKEPDLDRPIKVLVVLPESIAAKATARIKELTDELRADKSLFGSWMELALNRKLIGDYGAAEEIWVYVTQNWADDSTAYGNLADYYLMVAHDNDRAEVYLLRAIQKDPTKIIFYENAYSFYRFVKKDLAKTEQILNEGIANNQLNADGLKKLLADLKSVL